MIPQETLTKDMVRFAPGDDDVRIARAGHVFYVRPMRRGSSMVGRWDHLYGEQILLLPLLLPFAWGWQRVQRRFDWQVGVLRVGAASSWNDQRLRVVHVAVVPRHEDPQECIASLVDAINKGEYDPK